MHYRAGFSLIELLVAISVMAIVLAVAVPSLDRALTSNRMAGQANQLLLAMQLARSEALTRRRPVRVCASANRSTCGGSWADGWIVLAEDADTVVQIWDGLRSGMVFADPGSLPPHLRFMPDGSAQAPAGSFPHRFRVQLLDGRFNMAREIQVDATGRASVRPLEI